MGEYSRIGWIVSAVYTANRMCGAKCLLLTGTGRSDRPAYSLRHGMKQPIGDNAARKFSEGFYSFLGNGRSIEQSFELGCNAIDLADSPGQAAGVRKLKVDLNAHQGIKIGRIDSCLVAARCLVSIWCGWTGEVFDCGREISRRYESSS